jgi:hypothetical protein
METLTGKYSKIKGWGIDANPQNEPTYPLKNYTGDDHKRLSYDRPIQQNTDVEILHSNERPSVSSVYGTTVPPSGLSGRIRRWAFNYSEGSFGHWLPLLLADRINVWEGIISDFRRGHIPNIFAELGGKAEWKYNKKGLAKKVAVGIIIAAVAYALLSKKKKVAKR